MHNELVIYKLKFKRLISMSENNKDVRMIDSSTSTTKKRNYAQVADFMGSFSDKSSFYSYFKEQLQLFVPPYNMLNAKWLKQIISGKKKLMKAADVNKYNPPRYDEISVTNLYKDCIKLEGMAQYFPDSYPKNRQCDRQ